jgi:phenylalanyl-tRNA synthetase beta chain
MLVSLKWLKELIDIDVNVDQLAEDLTMLGLEIEAVERMGEDIKNVVVGHIQSIEPHPDADKLVVCKTLVGGEEPLQIICGAKNMQPGDKVPTAVHGSVLPGGFKIARRKMRGVQSEGMMCAASELGLGDDQDGLLILGADAPVGEDIVKHLDLDDVVFEIEITPNRGDWAGMIGVARELGALYNKPLTIPVADVQEQGQPVTDYASVTIEDTGRCPRYLGRVIRDVTLASSPPWLAQKLVSAGQRPINNVVDITNLVLLETGQPLHAFDYDKLIENRVVVRSANQGEVIKTIDEEERKLSADDLVIADGKNPVALAGIMGGYDSEVGEATQHIFLESAVFSPVSVRKSARAHTLITEASQRFQRGADPVMAKYALNRAAELLREVARGQVTVGILDEQPEPLQRRKLILRYDRTNTLLGAAVSADEQDGILLRLGFELRREADGVSATVSVPSWRHDISMETDLIEEIARLHGYGNIEAALPRIGRNRQVFAPEESELRTLRNFLVGLGLSEHLHWTFTNSDLLEKTNLGAETDQAVALANPLSEQQALMRTSLVPALLSTVSKDIRHGARNVAAFEIGPVFRAEPNSETGTHQETRLAIALTGARNPQHWSTDTPIMDFYDLKGYVECVLQHMHTPHNTQPAAWGPLKPSMAAQVTSLKSKQAIGHYGEVSARVLRAYDIEQPVYLCELTLTPLLAAPARPVQHKTVPQLPPSLRDLAVVVDDDVSGTDIMSAAEKAGGKLLQNVELFDIYTGKPIPEGKKSLALNLVFQAQDRTLTDKDTQKACDKILKRLQHDYGAELR